MLSELFKDLVWPDFKVRADRLWVVFRRVEERCFPRKSKDESSQLNDESSRQEKLPDAIVYVPDNFLF